MARCEHPNCDREALYRVRFYENVFFPDLINVCSHHFKRWREKDEEAYIQGKRPARLSHEWQYEKGVKWAKVVDGKWMKIKKPKTVSSSFEEFHPSFSNDLQEEGTPTGLPSLRSRQTFLIHTPDDQYDDLMAEILG